MRGRIALLVTVEAVVGVLLAIMINVATGGTLPDPLTPYRDLAWPLVGVLGVTAVLVPFWRFVLERPRRAGRSGYNSYYRDLQRKRVVEALQKRWIDGALAKSLAVTPRIDLRLTAHPEAVVPPADLIVQPQHTHDLTGHGIRQAFELMDRSMLILGAPGAGKSTLLLELAGSLLVDAREESNPIPIVFDLSRWPGKIERSRKDLDVRLREWCLDEMAANDGIPHRLGTTWWDEDRLLLLFDGLDEMPSPHRGDFVQALHHMQLLNGPMPVVICCRSADYAELAERLAVQAAVSIEPLDRAEIERYLDQHADRLERLQTALGQDEQLWEMLDSPLILNMMAVVSQQDALGRSWSRPDLLDRYIDVMISRRRFSRSGDARRWLARVAKSITNDHDWGNAIGSTWVRGWHEVVPEGAVRQLSVRMLPMTVLATAATIIAAPHFLPCDQTVALICGGAVLVAGLPRIRPVVKGVPFHATSRLVPDLVMGALTGVVLGALGAGVLALVSWTRMEVDELVSVIAMLIVTAPVAGSLLYRAIRVDQDYHPEKTARDDKAYREIAGRSVTEKFRMRNQTMATGDGRASMWAMYGIMYAVAGVLLAFGPRPEMLLAVTVGLVAGVLVGGILEFVTALARMPREFHPCVVFAEVVGPRTVIWGFVGLMLPGLVLVFWDIYLVQDIGGLPFVQWTVGTFLGLFGGQLAVHWLLATPAGDSAFGLVGRVFLSHSGALPWQLKKFLRYSTKVNLMNDVDGRYEFRHKLLLEHLAAPVRS